MKQMAISVPVLFDFQGGGKACAPEAPMNESRWIACRSATGKVGLLNLGVTCYVSAILQALCMNNE